MELIVINICGLGAILIGIGVLLKIASKLSFPFRALVFMIVLPIAVCCVAVSGVFASLLIKISTFIWWLF